MAIKQVEDLEEKTTIDDEDFVVLADSQDTVVVDGKTYFKVKKISMENFIIALRAEIPTE